MSSSGLSVQKMWYYLIGQRIYVISRVNPLWLHMARPSSLNCILAKWATLCLQYEMQFMPQKIVKVQVVADFLVDHPVSRSSKLYDDFSDEDAEVCTTHACSKEQVWELFFTGTSRTSSRGNIVAGVRVLLVSPYNYVIPRAFSLLSRVPILWRNTMLC